MVTGAPSNDDYYSFIVVGDVGLPQNQAQNQLSSTMESWAKDTSASHIVAVGDNIYYNGVNSVDDPKWITNWYNPFKKERSYLKNLPWHAMLGNHDYCLGFPEIEMQYNRYGWRMDDYFWSHKVSVSDRATASFIYLDTDLLAYGLSTTDWLRKDCPGMFETFQKLNKQNPNDWSTAGHLRKIEDLLKYHQKSDWVFVFGHHPLGVGPCGAEGQLGDLQQLLERYNIDMYVNGHVHSVDYGMSASGIPHFTSGAGGDTYGSGCKPNKPSHWSRDHIAAFMSCRIFGNSLSVTIVSSTGEQLFTKSFQNKQ
ncbi:hypothetical protein HDV02_002221 [Globomyces sp. JEL0801]|nr:hypothetical protein HDV02_002221 [Globomyces sp. JEL0801]